jgi:hypothetical protein
MEGGESDVVSSHNLWNTLQAERPDVAELLAKPNWYFDRKGEVSEGQNPWVQRAVSREYAILGAYAEYVFAIGVLLPRREVR